MITLPDVLLIVLVATAMILMFSKPSRGRR